MPNITSEQLVQQKNGEFKKENRNIYFLALIANRALEYLKRYKNIGFKIVIGKLYTSVSFIEQIGLALN